MEKKEEHLLAGDSRFLISSALLALCFLGALAYGLLVQLQYKEKEEISDTLETVLHTTKKSLAIWSDNAKADAKSWASLPYILSAIKEQLRVPNRPELLKNSESIKEMDRLLEPVLRAHGFVGYILIDKKYKTRASFLKTNIGQINLLKDIKGFLPKVFQGETLISPPVITDIPIMDSFGKLNPNEPTMFVVTPVYDESKDIIAALAFRLKPSKTFTQALQMGRMGKTGETYALSREGQLLSESRFNSTLQELGLIEHGSGGILSLEIRDPGGDLLEGYKSEIPRREQPLTYMANEINKKLSGENLEGYRDYRGVYVVGAWHWEEELGLGVTTEIDKNEAFKGFTYTCNLILVSFGLSWVLFFVFSFRVWIQRERLIQSSLKIRKLSQVIEQSRASVVITDIDGAIEYVNPYFEELTGYSSDEILGENPRILKAERKSPEEYKELWDTILSGKTWRGEFHSRKKNGELYWESTLISPVMDSGEITHFIAIKENVTSRKETEARLNLTEKKLLESQKLAGIGQLAAGVSHEVLNPVNIISLLTQMLQKDTTNNASLQEFCEKVMNEISRIQKIMGTLLAFSREGESKIEPVLLKNMIDEVLELIEKDFALDSINIFCQCECKRDIEPIQLFADKDELRQVFLNIFNNAKYAMPKGGSLTIDCDAIEKDTKKYVRLKISDTGTGIKEEDLGKVFDHFFTTKPEGEGTGLGLSVIHKIIEDHGGAIHVESEWGKGTTFIIDLPMA